MKQTGLFQKDMAVNKCGMHDAKFRSDCPTHYAENRVHTDIYTSIHCDHYNQVLNYIIMKSRQVDLFSRSDVPAVQMTGI